MYSIFRNRFVLAATDHLRHKMTRMEARMRSLEDALAIIHGSESDRPHPLLGVNEGMDEDEEAPQFRAVSEDLPQSQVPLREASGTLWLDGQGGSRFFGPSGGSEVCQSCPSYQFTSADFYLLESFIG